MGSGGRGRIREGEFWREKGLREPKRDFRRKKGNSRGKPWLCGKMMGLGRKTMDFGRKAMILGGEMIISEGKIAISVKITKVLAENHDSERKQM